MDLFFSSDGYPASQPDNSGGGTERRINQLETQVRELTRRIDRISLACQALWELVEAQGDMSDELLRHKMTEIDLRDGVCDGKIAMTVLVCPNCGNRSNSRRPKCIFCGHDVPSKHIFG